MDYDELGMPKTIWLNRGWPGYLVAGGMLCFAGYATFQAIVARPTTVLALAVPLVILHLGIAVGIFLPTHYDCLIVRHEGVTIRRFLPVMFIRNVSWENITGVVWYGTAWPWRGAWDLEYEDESGYSKIVSVHAHSRRSYEQLQHLTESIIQRREFSEKTVPHIPWLHLWRPRPKRIWR